MQATRRAPWAARALKTIRLGAAALLLGAGVAAAQAGGGWVSPDILDLRERLADLSREVDALRAGGAVGGGGGVVGDPGRLDRIEIELRRLTGEVERLSYEAQQSAQTRERKMAEFEFRITRLEGGDPSAAAAAGAPTEAYPGMGAEGPAAAAAVAGGAAGAQRLEPLQPQNGASGGRGAPPTVLGEINSAGGPDAVASPIYEAGPQAGGAAGADPYASYDPAAAGGAAAAAISAPVSFEEALKSIQAGDHAAAEGQLQAFIAQNPSDPRAGEATYWLGETYRVRGRYLDAARIYAKGLKEHPNSAKAPDSLLSLGISLAQLNQTERACEVLSQVEARFPDAPAVALRRAANEARRAGCR